MAEIDPLTQISNRRHFMSKACAYFESHRIEQQSLSILFIDIDHFKKINDTYGHLFGDEVLTKIAGVISNCIRPIDLCCRYGGEEFVVLLYQTNLEQSLSIGNRIRQNVENHNFETALNALLVSEYFQACLYMVIAWKSLLTIVIKHFMMQNLQGEIECPFTLMI